MAFTTFLFALLFVFASNLQLSTSHLLIGKISCLDCNSDYDLSGIMVMAKCEKVKKIVIATTEKDGSFKTHQLPLPTAINHCLTKLVGGPKQLYSTRNKMLSKIVKVAHSGGGGGGSGGGGGGDNSFGTFTISTPLSFAVDCHSITTETQKCAAGAGKGKFGSSKTIDIPLPPEWGLAPSSYYVPVLPIIGVP